MGRNSKDSGPPHPSKKQGSKKTSAAINNSKNGRKSPRPSTSSCDETKKANTGSSSSSPGGTAAVNKNRPRNWLLQDATSDVSFTFDVANHHKKSANKGSSSNSNRAPTCELRVQQTANEDTWPGGALWYSGVLLAQLLAVLPLEVEMALSSRKSTTSRLDRESPPPRTVTLACTHREDGNHGAATTVHHRHSILVPSRILDCHDVVNKIMTGSGIHPSSSSSSSSRSPIQHPRLSSPKRRRPSTILELGCGVGLTGMVAAVSMRATLTVLTDLPVVIEKVTQPNLKRNERILRQHGAGIVRAVPLTWGCHDDELHVQQLLRSELDSEQLAHQAASSDTFDWILVGDVAYQHRPGAPSHFDDLLSTLLRFTDPPTSHPDDDHDSEEPTLSFMTPIVVFATRIRMPASVDLLHMLLEHFDPMVDPPLEAHEINGASIFGHVKHNTTVHFFRRKLTTVTHSKVGT